MVRGTVSDALGGVPTVPSQGMSPQDVELSQYDHAAAADSVAGPSMQLRSVYITYLFGCVAEQGGHDFLALLASCGNTDHNRIFDCRRPTWRLVRGNSLILR